MYQSTSGTKVGCKIYGYNGGFARFFSYLLKFKTKKIEKTRGIK
jgi:hypothetical protein